MINQQFTYLKKLITIQFFIIYIFSQDLNLNVTNSTCETNLNCFQGCNELKCHYYPQNNSFYNQSLSRVNNYGPLCCQGCNIGYYLLKDNKTCQNSCTPYQGKLTYANDISRSCEFGCQNGEGFGNNITFTCVQRCIQGSFAHRQNNICVEKCYGNWFIGMIAQNLCVNTCNQYIWHKQDNSILCDKCPQGLYGDNYTNYSCVKNCSQGSYGHLQINICVKQCFGLYPMQNSKQNICESNFTEQLSNVKIIIISISSILLITILSILFIFMYKNTLKKYLIRKPWKSNMIEDITFTN